MARFENKGMDDGVLPWAQMARLPDELLDEMLDAEADIIVKAQKDVGEKMGIHRSGGMLRSIKKTKVKRKNDGRYIDVRPTGRNESGTLNTEVGFYNEFGKKGQPARPFMRTANEENIDKAVDEAAKIYDNWLDSL